MNKSCSVSLNFRRTMNLVTLLITAMPVMRLQVFKDRNLVAQLVKRAERAGFKAIVVTADTPRLGRREADIKNR